MPDRTDLRIPGLQFASMIHRDETRDAGSLYIIQK